MPQALTVVKSEAAAPPGGTPPVVSAAGAPLSVVKSEAAPPPGVTPPSMGTATSIRPTTWRDRLRDWTPSQETQRLIGGAGGALLGAAAAPEVAGGGLLIGAINAVPAIAGAALGGAGVASAQGDVAGAPDAAAEQGALEAGGQMVSWPIKAVGRRLLAHPVAQAAAKSLEAARTAVNGQLDVILSQAESAMRATREGVARATGFAKEDVRGAKAGLEGARTAADARTAEAASRWPVPAGSATPPPAAPPGGMAPVASHLQAAKVSTPPPTYTPVDPRMVEFVPPGEEAAYNASRRVEPPPSAAPNPVASHATPPPPGPNTVPGPESYAQVGRDVHDVIKGPAKTSRDMLGQAVGEAAASGPDLDITGIKSRLEAMSAETRPSFAAGKATEGGEYLAAAGGNDKVKAALDAAGIQLEASHPLPGVLKQLQDAPDTVSFADAHKLKRALDDATNWDSPAKKQLGQITKGIRGDLRTLMSSHAPYNQATQAYEAATPLFTKGVAKQISRSAQDNPEAIVKMIRGDQPTKLKMLQEVLIHHAEQGGGAEQGQAAWNGVRSAWTYENLIKGGIEKFPERLGKVHPDFLTTMYGDGEGKAVLGNLKQISEAYKGALQTGEQEVGAASKKVADATATAGRTADQGRLGIATKARDLGAVREQVAVGKKPTAVEQAFKSSSLAGSPPPGQVVGDVVHTAAMHGANVFRVRSAARLFFSGPKASDLVQWAAYSGPKTQALVKALTGPEPGMALTDLYRVMQGEAEEANKPQGPPGPPTR